MTSNEEKLDQYIDALNAGGRPSIDADDAELRDLMQTVDQLQVLREPAWPPESFAGDLAARLSSDLTVRSNGHINQTEAIEGAETVTGNPWFQHDKDVPRLEAFPPPVSRLRRSFQAAGALTAFMIFALVLALVFGDVNGESSGMAPSDIRDRGQITFAMQVGGNQDIYRINDDGTGLIRLTEDPANDLSPAWSPDGSRLSFISNRGGTYHLYTIDADGSDVRQLTYGPHQYMTPEWSPDGGKIAAVRFASDDPNDTQGELVIMNPDGSGLTSLTENAPVSTMSRFTWSPDGQEIALTIELSGRGPQVLVYRTDGTGIRNLYPNDAFQWFPEWSPDGDRIAITESEMMPVAEGGAWITLLDADGENPRTLLTGTSNLFEHSWSPDGSQLAVSMSNEEQGREIVVVPIDAVTEPPVLDDTAYYLRYPEWSPDGARIAFIRHNEVDGAWILSLFVANPDGSNPIRLADNVLSEPPTWRPTSTTATEDNPPRVDELAVTQVPQEVAAPEEDEPPINLLPTLWISGGPAVTEGVSGSYGWVDEANETYMSVTAPFIDVGDGGLSVQPEDVLALEIGEDAPQPESATVSIYTWADNNAIPEDDDGNVADRAWFLPATDPISQSDLAPENMTVRVPEESGRYVVQIEVRWPAHPDLPDTDQYAIHVTYAANVYVVDHNELSDEDLLTIDEAIDIVRDYLGDAEAELRANYQDDHHGNEYIWVQHDIGSETQHGVYHVDSRTGEIVSGGNPLTSTLYVPEKPITDDQALQVAEDFVRGRLSDMSRWELIDDGHSRIGPGSGEGDRLWTVMWHEVDPETGVMLPSRISVVINTRTGLIASWNIQMIEYDGPMVPAISEQRARDLATDNAEQMGIASPLIESIGLSVQAFPGNNVRLVWSISVENPGDGGPDVALYTIDAFTGAMLDQMGEDIE